MISIPCAAAMRWPLSPARPSPAPRSPQGIATTLVFLSGMVKTLALRRSMVVIPRRSRGISSEARPFAEFILSRAEGLRVTHSELVAESESVKWIVSLKQN